MIKDILIYTVVFFILYLITFQIHFYFIGINDLYFSFSLNKIYKFHLIFSLLLCTNFRLLLAVNKFSSQLGFLYLGSLMLKLCLFCVIFYKPIFTEENLTQAARISLLIPALLFLLTETFFVARILNSKL